MLFRLDGTIDHILVDEAQDTSPAQWQVIEKLAQEFTSGKGARDDKERTIFVVGDKKQSIYSFQGADPREFDRMQAEFAARLKHTPKPLAELEMEFSFRSSQAILSLVDHTFQDAEKSGFTPKQRHKAHKSNLPGRVDLWPYVLKPEVEKAPPWHMPVDVKAANDPNTVLARHIAETIQQLIDTRHPIPESKAQGDIHSMRPITAGDFLILVQRRSELFYDIIRECKERGLPIAGADRLRVGAELAVRDIAALLSFLALPEDSYSLAVALKSPLFGWSEADLYHLAQPRSPDYLWQELRDRAADYPETMTVIWDLLEKADFLRPYDLIERILTRHHGRHRLLSRLGPEAEEGIDALLAQAMNYEQNSVDSLTGFLVWLETDDLEIKRQIDSTGDLIRVMTVHGAKGLEAPIVILPETGTRKVNIRNQVIEIQNAALWRTNSNAAPSRMVEAMDEIKQAERAERDRLLYVAMTRAEKWLIVAAAGDPGTKGETWYEKVELGMRATGAADFPFSIGDGLRLETGSWGEVDTDSKNSADIASVGIEDFFAKDATIPIRPRKTISPSDLGGAKALPGESGLDEEAAKRRGRQVHKLLEFLPQTNPEAWLQTAGSLLQYGVDRAEGDELVLLLAEAQKVLTKPSLAHLFDPAALAEVSITATLDALDGQRVHGKIDRLLISDTHALAVDFKTNAMVPDNVTAVPDGVLRQLGAYAHALKQVYPGREIQTAILWTRTATLMYLPHDIVTEALNTTQIS